VSTVRIAHCADPGPRENLEDCVHAAVLELHAPTKARIPIAMLLDGAGGHNAGEIASLLGTRRIASTLTGALADRSLDIPKQTTSESISHLLAQALQAANAAVLRASTERPEHRDMATTAVCFVVWDGTLYAAWAGDSRCYIWRGGRIHRLTRDHTTVQGMIDEGLLTVEEAKSHPLAHIIDQCLGMADSFTPGLSSFPLSAGDIVLLCSDGLTDVMTDADLADLIADHAEEDIVGLPRRLVEEAMARGTADNVTVLCYEHQLEESQLDRLSQTVTGVYPSELAMVFQRLS